MQKRLLMGLALEEVFASSTLGSELEALEWVAATWDYAYRQTPQCALEDERFISYMC
jgi:hypothetical protein